MKVKKFAEEFKAFIAKGNVVDMAVAVIIGGAFGKIVTSLVNDVIMPVVGLVVGRLNVSELKWVIEPATVDSAGNVSAEVALCYGNFLQTVLDFLIVSLCVFVMLKVVLGAKDKIIHKKEEEPEPEEDPAPTTEELLTEIRDLLKKDAGESEEASDKTE